MNTCHSNAREWNTKHINLGQLSWSHGEVAIQEVGSRSGQAPESQFSPEGRKEGNVLFNDALNTFYLRLYGVRHMVKYHSDSERKPAAATWATLSDYQQGFFHMHHPTDRTAYTTAFVAPVVEHWLEREIAQWVHPMKDRSDDPSHHERTLLPRSYISLPVLTGCWF